MLLPVYVIGFVLVIALVSYGVTISRMMSVRVRGSRSLRRIERQDVPSEIRRLLEQRGLELESLGFSACGAIAEDYLVDGVDEPSWSLLYRDAAGTSVARLTLAESPTRVQPVELEFYSFGADGQVVETVAWRAHRLAPGLPDQQLRDAQTLSWEVQWQVHR